MFTSPAPCPWMDSGPGQTRPGGAFGDAETGTLAKSRRCVGIHSCLCVPPPFKLAGGGGEGMAALGANYSCLLWTWRSSSIIRLSDSGCFRTLSPGDPLKVSKASLVSNERNCPGLNYWAFLRDCLAGALGPAGAQEGRAINWCRKATSPAPLLGGHFGGGGRRTCWPQGGPSAAKTGPWTRPSRRPEGEHRK